MLRYASPITRTNTKQHHHHGHVTELIITLGKRSRDDCRSPRTSGKLTPQSPTTLRCYYYYSLQRVTLSESTVFPKLRAVVDIVQVLEQPPTTPVILGHSEGRLEFQELWSYSTASEICEGRVSQVLRIRVVW